MKKIYNAPEAIEVLIKVQDVITASKVTSEESGDGLHSDWEDGQ